MIKKIMINRFGGLKNYTLNLDETINVIQAENEAGKSTACGFIKAMLYGFLSGRKQDVIENDKKRFMTWGETSVSGSMEIGLVDGRTIVIERVLAEKPSQNKISVKDKETQERLPLYENCPGEAIYGVTADEFERTAFLGQNLHKIEKSDTLTTKLSNMSQTADEDVPANRAIKMLDEARKYYDRQMKNQKEALKKADFDIYNATEQKKLNDDLRLKKEEVFLMLHKAQQDRDDLKAEKAFIECKKLDELKKELTLCQQSIKEKEAFLKNNDFLADYEYVNQLKTKMSLIREMTARAEEKKEQLGTFLKTKGELLNSVSDFSWFRENPDGVNAYNHFNKEALDLKQKIQKAQAIEQEILKIDQGYAQYNGISPSEYYQKKRWTIKIPPAGLLCFSLGVLLFSAFTYLFPAKVAGYAALVLGIVGFLIFFFVSNRGKNQKKEMASISEYESVYHKRSALKLQLAEILEEKTAGEMIMREKICQEKLSAFLLACGCEDEAGLRQKQEEYLKLLSKTEWMEGEIQKAQQAYSELIDRCAALFSDFIFQIQKLYPHITDEMEAKRMIAQMENALLTLSSLQQNQKRVQDMIKTLLDGRDEETLYAFSQKARQNPKMEEKALLHEKIKEAEETYIQMLKEYEKISAMLEEGEKNSLSLDEAYEKKSDIGQKLLDYTLHAEGIALASETLRKSLEEMQKNFAPQLNAKAGEYLKEITDGKYREVYINKDYRVEIGDRLGITHDIEYFSAGTMDQIYLSLRLALLDMLQENSQPLPLILDDAFCQFDDQRLKNALLNLWKVGHGRQVILFTCHNREDILLKGILAGSVPAGKNG